MLDCAAIGVCAVNRSNTVNEPQTEITYLMTCGWSSLRSACISMQSEQSSLDIHRAPKEDLSDDVDTICYQDAIKR